MKVTPVTISNVDVVECGLFTCLEAPFFAAYQRYALAYLSAVDGLIGVDANLHPDCRKSVRGHGSSNGTRSFE